MNLSNIQSSSPQEALENFDKAAQALGFLKDSEGTIAYAIASGAYKRAKEELLVWMSYIP